ncbi:MAG: HORMA domain containing protein [Sphingomonadales bacterium]|nr:HORMA domain containing protein [Sphingomonadales bacterium]MBK6491865.1 HORMA domain containing protein [Sphingomonadales bacterium]MBK6718725.1 HORMA domain containing protein [Sphingomonadales bacterium]MBK8271905.1 HORMA domain containing protein [Sphingomonadales bacterium]
MTMVAVNTYTHSVTYVTDNILKSLKDIIRLSGLDPSEFVGDWASSHRAISAWLETHDLAKVILEIFDPFTNSLIGRWDMDIAYGWTGDGGFYTDTDQIKYHIRKAGLAPSQARYRLVVRHRPGARDVAGWSSTTLRSTDGLSRQSLGSTVEHAGLGASASYWRKN